MEDYRYLQLVRRSPEIKLDHPEKKGHFTLNEPEGILLLQSNQREKGVRDRKERYVDGPMEALPRPA